MPTPKNPIHDDIIYGRAALRNGEPWIVPESLDHLKRIIQPDWKVFEWGSGGSTVFWSKHCQQVISIEHNSEWIMRTTELLTKHDCKDNRTLHYVAGVLDANGQMHHLTSFRNYADAILSFVHLEPYDLIYIDGEASSRGWCLTHALSRVRQGGYLLLDNSNWLEGHDFGPDWERWDYVARGLSWVGQEGTFDWWTSILQRKE